MDIIILEGGAYTVAALGHSSLGKTESAVMEYLACETIGNKPLVEALRSIFQMYAEKGRDGVTASMFHEANKAQQIWQFSKGNHRIYCFKDPDEKKLLLLGHGCRKTSKKVKRSDLKQVISLRDQYLKAKQLHNLRQLTLEQLLRQEEE